jgi:hypothetical protein
MNQLPAPILITGAARSGTSMVAGSIHICGAFGGRMSGPNQNNRKGMFENAELRNQIVKPYLKELGVDRLGQYPLPEIAGLPIPHNWRERVERVMVKQGYESGPWMYKGAKMCLFWPVWQYAFPEAKWIIVRRRTEDIVNSCIKTSFMRAFRSEQVQQQVQVNSEAAGWEWWVYQHIDRFRQMIEHGMNVKVVWPEKMVKGNYQEMYEAMEWLGLEWDSNVMKFIEPKLWKARQ